MTVNIENLTKLRDWLIDNFEFCQSHLNFEYFVEEEGGLQPSPWQILEDNIFSEDHCDTTCCLLGFAAVSHLFPAHEDSNWHQYCSSTFGINPGSTFGINSGSVPDPLWHYLFDGCHKNDLQAAIERINYVIENGSYPAEYVL